MPYHPNRIDHVGKRVSGSHQIQEQPVPQCHFGQIPMGATLSDHVECNAHKGTPPYRASEYCIKGGGWGIIVASLTSMKKCNGKSDTVTYCIPNSYDMICNAGVILNAASLPNDMDTPVLKRRRGHLHNQIQICHLMIQGGSNPPSLPGRRTQTPTVAS